MSSHISRIELVSRAKRTYRIHFEPDSEIEILEDSLLHFCLSKGSALNNEIIEKLVHFDQVMRCVHQAYRFLSRRPHLEAELRRKLFQKNFHKDHIRESIVKLRAQGYLNDLDFIRMFIREESNRKRTGPLLIRKKLLEKGADREQAETLLDSEYSNELLLQNTRYLIGRLQNKPDLDPLKKMQKQIRALQQKGYPFNVIQEVMQESEDEHPGDDYS